MPLSSSDALSLTPSPRGNAAAATFICIQTTPLLVTMTRIDIMVTFCLALDPPQIASFDTFDGVIVCKKFCTTVGAELVDEEKKFSPNCCPDFRRAILI